MEDVNQTLLSGADGGPARGARLPPDSRIPLSAMMDIYYFKIISFAILYFLITVGFITACLTIRRPNIRKHSSAIYLFAMIISDFILMGVWWLPWLLQFVRPDLEFDSDICRIIQAFTFTFRFGSCSIIIALALERVLVISNPKRFARFATPQLAVIVSICCIIITFLFGSYTIHELGWKSKRRCAYVIEAKKNTRAIPQNGFKIAAAFAGVAILLVVNIILGAKLHQKKQRAKNDPIKSSINNARNQSNQLNKINLICFVMSVMCLVATVPTAANVLFYWNGTLKKLTPKAREQVLAFTQFIAMFFLATKWIFIGVSSPKIRREAWLAIKCFNDRKLAMQLAKPENIQRLRDLKKKESSTVGPLDES